MPQTLEKVLEFLVAEQLPIFLKFVKGYAVSDKKIWDTKCVSHLLPLRPSGTLRCELMQVSN